MAKFLLKSLDHFIALFQVRLGFPGRQRERLSWYMVDTLFVSAALPLADVGVPVDEILNSSAHEALTSDESRSVDLELRLHVLFHLIV